MYLPADRQISRAVVPLKGAISSRFTPATQLPKDAASYTAQSFPRREAVENSQIELFKISLLSGQTWTV